MDAAGNGETKRTYNPKPKEEKEKNEGKKKRFPMVAWLGISWMPWVDFIINDRGEARENMSNENYKGTINKNLIGIFSRDA